MSRRAWGVIGAAAVVAVAAAVLLSGAGRTSHEAHGSGLVLGRAAGAVALATARMTGWRRPIRCLRDAAAAVPDVVVAGNRTFHRDGARLVGGNRDGRVKLGVVADARGADAATLANLAWARKKLAAEKVDAVLVLGGMGGTKDELAQTLGALANDAPWMVVAQAGERESVPALAGAIAGLAAEQAPIVDGAAARIVVIDGVAIGFLPGLATDPGGRAHGGRGRGVRPHRRGYGRARRRAGGAGWAARARELRPAAATRDPRDRPGARGCPRRRPDRDGSRGGRRRGDGRARPDRRDGGAHRRGPVGRERARRAGGRLDGGVGRRHRRRACAASRPIDRGRWDPDRRDLPQSRGRSTPGSRSQGKGPSLIRPTRRATIVPRSPRSPSRGGTLT